MIGQIISHYRVVEKLGAGGMGEVYRARDERLGREVAIKVLPEAFARDAERLARFEREAHLLASLNHPNIAAIYGLEESDGKRFLVLELVEGETLTERLGAGPLPVEDALGLCRQIAVALEAAHEKGIIHRDLKPTNVKVTPQGQVKVLDFGLAKAFAGDPAPVDALSSPTVSDVASRIGVLLGTAAYMSPEQARAKPVDKRTDIWAFGCVLYELLTGKQAFPGETISDTLAAVIKTEPDWRVLPATTPPAIGQLLRRCLEKDSKERLRDIGEARIEIEHILTGSRPAVPALAPPVAPARAAWRGLLPWALVALLGMVAAVGLWDRWQGRSRPELAPKRFTVALPATGQLNLGPAGGVALSPDGSYLGYDGTHGAGWQLFLRPLGRLEATPLPGTDEGTGPFFSPDSHWLGFFSGGKLKKVSLQGGAPITLCDLAAELRGATWGPDGTIVFAQSGISGLHRVPAAGGTPEVLTKADSNKGERSHRWPQFLPGGKTLLFTIETAPANYDDARISALSLETKQYRTLIEGGTNPHYLPSGHIVYARAGTLLAVPFDLERLEVTGEPVPVVEGVTMNPVSGAAYFATSGDGTLVYAPGGAGSAQVNLVWVDRGGTARPLPVEPRGFQQPSISPDGKKVAVHVFDEPNDVWVYELARGTLTRLTFQPGEDESPVWSPDNKRVAFSSSVGSEPRAFFWKNADGSGSEERVAATGYHTHLGSFSPDGRSLAFTDYDTETRGDIWLVSLEGDRKAQAFLKTPFNEREPKFSPDGRWIAYTSNESGRDEIYVQAFPGPGGKWQVSTEGGYGPAWPLKGRELFYRSGNRMMAVNVSTHPTFSASTPRVLFEGVYELHPRRESNYDVTPDGQRFLMIQASRSEAASFQLHVVLNWLDELKRRVPAGKN